MTRCRTFVAALVAAASIAGTAAPQAGALSYGSGVDLLAQRGFGSSANGYAWGMAWFKGKLYVGTGRQVACVEAWTRSFFLPILQPFTTNPSANTQCARDQGDFRLRAEIWQWTPKTDTWRRVYRSPVQRNPRAKGKWVAKDIAYRGMAVHEDPKGRETLWITGVTADEYLPELKRTAAPRLLHTRDGRHFEAASPAPTTTVTTLTGKQKPMGFRSLQWIHGRMFLTASTGLTGDGAAVEVKNPLGRRLKLRQVSPPNVAVFEMGVYRDRLYLGTGNPKTGYGLYRAWDAKPHWNRFKKILDNGAGRGVKLTSVVSMGVYRNRLYVGSSGWTNEQRTLPATEVIRVDAKDRWQVVTGEPRAYNGSIKFPISGLGDGWGTGFTAHPWRMAVVGKTLYAGTNDFSSTLINQGYPLLQTMLSSGYGYDIWATCDGTYWFPATYNAFGGSPFDFGARTLVPTPRGLVVGSADHANGTTIGLIRRDPCSAGIRTARGPRSLLADAQRDGTVVSWDRGAPAGTRYRVLRAEVPDVEVSVKPPAIMPNGFALEGAAPSVVPPDTPGSTTTAILGYGTFEDVGVTTRSVFVDRTRKPGVRYAYRVVADGPDGPMSSGVEQVPSPVPAPTLPQVQRTIGDDGPVAHSADASTALPALRRAARTPEQRDLVDRLRRSLEYRDLAGGH